MAETGRIVESRAAVVAVDIQADFTTVKTGSLAVAGADEKYLNQVKQAIDRLHAMGLPVIATQDWHPEGHISLVGSHSGVEVFTQIELADGRVQIIWPDHCVQQTPGAELLLDEQKLHAVVRKGSDPEYDSYSGFADDGGAETGLNDILTGLGVKKLIIFGLATDVCVKFTILDALDAGHKVLVIKGLSRAVDPDNVHHTWNELADKGAELVEDFAPEHLAAWLKS